MNDPASPCIKVCRLDAAQVCIGCGRSLDEIAQWPGAGRERQLQILDNARRRLDDRLAAPASFLDPS